MPACCCCRSSASCRPTTSGSCAPAARIGEELNRNGFIMRYTAEDDFGAPETAFLVCQFWYIDALAAARPQGRGARAVRRPAGAPQRLRPAVRGHPSRDRRAVGQPAANLLDGRHRQHGPHSVAQLAGGLGRSLSQLLNDRMLVLHCGTFNAAERWQTVAADGLRAVRRIPTTASQESKGNDEPARPGIKPRLGLAQGGASGRRGRGARRRCAQRKGSGSAGTARRRTPSMPMWSSRDARTATVPLTPDEHAGYYLGYANSVLWPVFHNRLDLAQFEAGYFERYSAVNRRLARLLQPLLRPDDMIWVHDYHLIPFASELRKLGVQNPIGFYLHIPFPPWQTFMAIPEHQQLARGLVGLRSDRPADQGRCRQSDRLPGERRVRPHRAGRAHPGVRPAGVHCQLPGRHRRGRLRQRQARHRLGAGARLR